MVASRIWVAALGAVALAASCLSGCSAAPGAGGAAAASPSAPAGSAGRACAPRGCISVSRLAHSIDSQLSGNVVGYVALVGRSKVVASGLARTAADPPKLAMGPNVMVNVLSVGKMFTTIAVLQSLARHHRSIDSRIWPFLPPDWVKGPGIDTITFRELLTHRAGFRLGSGLVFKTDDAAGEQIRQGIQQVDKQVADYNNINFTIFRDMLPFMEGVRDPGPAARAAAADRFFLSYVQRQVFDPVGVTDATCAPVRHAMLMYPPPGAVDRDPGDHRREESLGRGGLCRGDRVAQPGFLDRVLGLAHAAEDPAGDREQQRPQLLELLGPGHVSSSLGQPVRALVCNLAKATRIQRSGVKRRRPPVTDCGLRGPRLVVCYPFCTAAPARGWAGGAAQIGSFPVTPRLLASVLAASLIGVGAGCMLLVPGEAPAQVGSLAARTSTGLMSGGAASSASARCSSAAAIGPSR